MTAFRIERARRRGAFGLDERRFPDPRRVETELRAFLAARVPDVWPVPTAPERAGDEDGRTLALLLPRGHVVVLRIERDPARAGAAARALEDRCRAMRIPHAIVSNLAEGRAALRRFGVEPRPERAEPARPSLHLIFGRT